MSDYLTPDDIAERLGLRVETVRKWIRSGHLPAINVGDGPRPVYRVDSIDFAAWLEARQTVARATA